MNERPLFIDVSSHQTYLNLDKAAQAGNDVLGIIMRAGKGLLKDVDFDAFDNHYDWDKIWRASYWALWPEHSATIQVDKWLEVDPEGSVYMLDCELTNGLPASYVGACITLISDLMLEFTGKRPWIYGGYYFLRHNLIPFVTEEWLNEHYFVLAQYDIHDGVEYDGINLPDKIDIDRVIFKQTTDKLELYPGSGNVDRDRFLLGEADDLNDFMAEYTGVITNPDPYDCDMLLDRIEAHNSAIGTLQSNEVWLKDKAQANASEIEKLRNAGHGLAQVVDELRNEYDEYADVSWAQVLKNKGEIERLSSNDLDNQIKIDSLQSLTNINNAELLRRMDELTNRVHMDAASSLARDAALEGWLRDLETKTIPETNHSHWWQRWFK